MVDVEFKLRARDGWSIREISRRTGWSRQAIRKALAAPAKQRHTARRIYDRLVSEHGFTGAEVTVRQAVARLRGARPRSTPRSTSPPDSSSCRVRRRSP
ncbi:MAG: hypothetical protein MUD05_10485 [Candidatus Nanopelagicales bacterium]|jgi:transposase|nr:hypothetical protein [Candidatus Nanopelagicales bacterium]